MVRTIEAEGATSASVVPTMMIALEEEVDRDGRLAAVTRLIVTGGSPVPLDVERRWIERYGVGITNTYGMTEASPVICDELPAGPRATCRSRPVGPPLPHVEVDVVDLRQQRAACRSASRASCARAASMVMNGYWDNEAATRGAIDEDGFLRSGDLARMDENGYVSITGRAKEMIIRGGENIYPGGDRGRAPRPARGRRRERHRRARRALRREAAAFVRLADGASLSEEQMREQLGARVARYKIPRYLVELDAFPVTPSGKVQKFKLREEFMAARGAN